MTKRIAHAPEDFAIRQRFQSHRDDQTERQKMVATQGLTVGGVTLAERRAGQCVRWNQLVADYIDRAREIANRRPVLRFELESPIR